MTVIWPAEVLADVVQVVQFISQPNSIAVADPDNPPTTEDEPNRLVVVRLIKRTRERLRLTQPRFAERYRINLGRLRDLEQGRCTPDSAMLSYLRPIARDPEYVARVLRERAA